ncbi:MAG: hypothetical protein HQK64_07430 [Desulfamplus sp.]|nr:hypothetical protein [Desulfamplus sp.]MBF0389494.1 hypothetical protein [Desulfamplus sp.]
MDFDERLIKKEHVTAAIEKYLSSPDNRHSARSAFLIHEEHKLPAKFIIRLAFEIATGHMPHPETLTGGKASIRVLQNLGFNNAIYEKQHVAGGKRNKIKSIRREALRKILLNLWSDVEIEKRIKGVFVPDLTDKSTIEPSLLKILDAIQAHRQITVKGKKNFVLAFDFFIPSINLPIEFDERQHFTPLRAIALNAYSDDTKLGFDKIRWINLSDQIRAGDNSPIYRDEQRAFYDSIRDILAPRVGLKPVVRIFEDDVKWETEESKSDKATAILTNIENLISR